MAIITASSPLPASAATLNDSLINNTILPSIKSNRILANPIEIFNQDYNECNGILSAMSPFAPLQPVSTKRKESDVCKEARAVCKKVTKQPTLVSSPRQVIVAAVLFATSVVASKFVVPSPQAID